MMYLRGTRNLVLILGDNGDGDVLWWADAAFAVHSNMRSHSGGGMSMGTGFPIIGSMKQKLTTRSSTEAEVVGADDFAAMLLWTRYFLIEQGYELRDTILYQDNRSAILLEKNGRQSSGSRSRHINIRFYFLTDRICKKELRVDWCPTRNMILDYATKALQGSQFRSLRDEIMGVVPTRSALLGEETIEEVSVVKKVKLSKTKSAAKAAKRKAPRAAKGTRSSVLCAFVADARRR